NRYGFFRCSTSFYNRPKKFIPFVKEAAEGVYAETICPIISEGDAIGAVVLAGRDERSKMSETEQKLAATAAVFLGKQMEQ
ncbi:MAG: hypothetical protein LUE31_09025, partial [Lachnospiraceae bacterium]|nr:hypothetical protein [Lachnospiraceae bacterium]